MTPWTATCQASLSFTVSWSLLRFVSIESVMLCNQPIFCCPLLLLPSIFHSIRVFSSELAPCISWRKYWSFTVMPILYSNHACSEIHWIFCLIILHSIAQESMGFPDSSVGKESACNAGDLGLIPGLGRCPGEGKGYSLQYPGLENSLDCIVHWITKSQTRLSNFHFHPVYRKIVL